MTTRAHINPYELDTEVDLGVDTQADTALPDEIGHSFQDSMTEKSSLPFVLQFPQSQDVRRKNNITKSLDNSTCHWTGEVINEQDQERFYAAFSKNGEEYTLDESVLATSPNKKLPTIGQIHCLWEDKKTGKRIVELKVYYRPEETKEGRKPFQAPKELLDSNYFAQFTLDQVTKKCSVESYEKFRRRREFPDDVYYFQDFYDCREQRTIEETPTDNFSFRRRIVNIALNSRSPVKAKEQPLKTSSKAPVNITTKTNNTTKTPVNIEKAPKRNSQESTQKQNSKGSEPEIDEDATIKLTMPPIEDDDFDFGVIEELAGITNNNSIAKHSTNIQEASTLITTQRDVERKKSPSLSDDETTSGGSDKRSKVSPKKTSKASESSSSNSKTTLSVQPTPTRASKSAKKGNSSPVVSSSLMTDDSEDMIMKELEIEEEEVTQAKSRSRITRQASTVDQSVNSNSKSKPTKAQTPKKKPAKDESDEEFEDPEEERPKPKTRGRPKKQPAKKQESEEEASEHEEPVSEEEERPKPKKTRAQAKKAEPKKKAQQKADSVEASDEEETAILEALERETEQLDAVRTNSAKKKKLRAYTDNDEDEQSDGDKSGPSSPTKIPQTRARGKSAKSSETPRKSTKSAFEFEGSEEKSDEDESPRKKRATRRLSVNSNDSKARDKKPKIEVEEDVENEDSISDSEEKKKWTSPRKNKGPASKREKIKEMLQKYPKLSELDNNDPFEDYDKANDVFEAATEPIVVDVEKFNGRTMKQALDTEDNDFELDNFLKDTPRTKRQKQLTPLVSKNDFGSRLGSLSNRMKYYQNWDIAETKEVIDVDDDSQDNKKTSNNNSIGSYSSRPKNKSAQMKLDFAPVTEKTSSAASLSRSNHSNSGTPVRKSPYFSSNQQSTPPSASKVKVKTEHDPFISSILSKYDDDEVEEKDKEIIDLSTQRPVSQVVTKTNKPVAQDVDEDDFKSQPKKKEEMEDFDEFDVESMLREVEKMGGEDSEPKESAPVIAIDDSSLDGHKNNVSKNSSRKKIDTSPSSDNNSESSTTRDSKKRKRGSDERKQRTLGTLNIIGAPEPNLLAEPPKKKRRLSEHIDRVKSKLRYGMDEEEVFMDKEEDEEMDDELRDFIVDDNAELSQYESQALPIDDVGDEDSARDDAASQSSVKALADTLVKEGETKFLSTTFKMSDAFKIFIQYLVSCMLDPHFASEVERKQDDYFRPAVRKIHDDLFSKKEVIIRSSAWNAQFKSNLDRLPVFRSYKMSHPEGECDACKRSMHTASWQIVLEGVSYDATAYWKDGPTNTNPNPNREPEQYTYNLGRFCHKRTELFHRLHHYKIRLNEQITERMNQLPSSLSENEVIDTILDDQLWINRLWKQFQVLREDALQFGAKGSEDGHD